jgi:hypothetical protein
LPVVLGVEEFRAVDAPREREGEGAEVVEDVGDGDLRRSR